MTVCMKQVLSGDISLLPISNDNKLPNACNKQMTTQNGAKRMSNMDHDAIEKEIHCGTVFLILMSVQAKKRVNQAERRMNQVEKKNLERRTDHKNRKWVNLAKH